MEDLNIPKTINLEKNNTLLLNLEGLRERKYGVSVKYYNSNGNKPYKRLDYVATIYINKNQEGWLFDIAKENIFFNQHEPDLVSEAIGNLISEALYPVQTCTDKSITSSKGITNHNQILNRWERNKSVIKGRYFGSAIESFITSVDKKISNKIHFEKSMQYDMFWNLLFHPKHLSYTENLQIKTNLFLAILPYQHPIEFTGIQTLHLEITDSDSIMIDFISDEISAIDHFIPENSNSELKYLMRLKVFFDLDFYYFFPMHIRSYFEVYSKDNEGVESILKRISFTQYQQDTENNKTSPYKKRGPFQVYEEEDKVIYKTHEGKNYTYIEWKTFEEEQYRIYKERQKKKGFWDFLG